MRTAFINELMTLAAQDERIVLMTGDLGFSVVEDFVAKYPKRFINAGISEQNMAGMAAGLALSGKMVFVYSIVSFATIRCLEQIRNDICYHNANVKIVSVGAGFSYGSQGYTHYGIEDMAIMRSLPNLVVASPSDPVETSALVRKLADFEGPAYLRLGKAKERVIHTDPNILSNYNLPHMVPVINNNSRRTILSTGAITGAVYDRIMAEKLDYNLWSVPCIKPLDENTLLKIAQSSDSIFTVEEHQLSGGFGSAILEGYEKLVRQNKLAKFPMIKRLGLDDIVPKNIGSQTYLRELIELETL